MLPTNKFIHKEIKNEIMSTDVYIGVVEFDNSSFSSDEIKKDINTCFDMFRTFEKKFSRFVKNNELYKFNLSGGWIEITTDFYELLELSIKYYKYTSGVFDISVYQNLIEEGYDKSHKDRSSIDYANHKFTKENNFSDLKLKGGKVFKPAGLSIEFGGIGKGLVVQKVATFLIKKYKNFIVDAGGDIYFGGKDLNNGYNYWACNIEDPNNSEKTLATLIVSNMGVATSGINKRRWVNNFEPKTHLINPKTGKSVVGNILSVTVVSEDTLFSDVLAKSLLIMGKDDGLEFCEKKKIAAVFVDDQANLFLSSAMNQYVWKDYIF